MALVENGSKGDRLLFRYPYDTQATPNFAKRTRASKLLRNSITSGVISLVFSLLYCAEQLQTPYPQISAEDMQKTSAAYSSTISGSVHSFPSKVCSY